jgi:hypothetical protein
MYIAYDEGIDVPLAHTISRQRRTSTLIHPQLVAVGVAKANTGDTFSCM